MDEVLAHYYELQCRLGVDMAYTVTIPDSGILTVDEAVRRMGFDTAGPAAAVDAVTACLTVVEPESGVRLDGQLIDGPHSIPPIPAGEFDPA
jgi:hypothetical protein